MGNMSYCKFRNTLSDMYDCLDDMDSELLLPEEARARKRLIELCREIVEQYGQQQEEEEGDAT